MQIRHTGEPQLLSFGLPLPEGFAYSVKSLIIELNGKPLRFQLKVSASWPDGSIRWLLSSAIISESGELTVRRDDTANLASDSIVIESIDISKDMLFKIDELGLLLKLDAQIQNETQSLVFSPSSLSKVEKPISIEYAYNASCEVGDKALNVSCKFIKSKFSSDSQLIFRIHNGSAAAHEGDTWDLGDVNSIYLYSLALQFEHKHQKKQIHVSELNNKNSKTSLVKDDDFVLHQYSSGGKNWKSPIHWNENKESTVKQHGYELIDNQDVICFSGLRADPFVALLDNEKGMGIHLKDFWQNFPLSVKSTAQGCDFSLFPSVTELQGGESKTWQFTCYQLDPNLQSKNIKKLRNNTCDYRFYLHHLNSCKVFPHLYFDNKDTVHSTLIQKGIEGEQSFFEKREKIDEYGWRNYGDLYADHEAVSAKDGEYFVSHYNNQYDPLFGLSFQYLLSGRREFFDLLAPLNQHIQDIDIYDTDQDKAEYNGGLMWHTDHYLSAETCTHRSNSKYHSQAYEGFLGGGGPGGQHCYTTGLLFQYRFFADLRAKEKVEQLCNWVRRFYNGSDSILDRTFRFVTIDIKKDAYTNIGKKFPGFRYPLDRGTANYIIALLDNFDINQDKALIEEAAFVIQNTVHPHENLALRDLQNVEETWFYTVFLQAVVRFLFVKESIGEIDNSYRFSRQALLHYGEWIFDNESFYLDSPEKLEFPNDTWCAQDIRKGNLLYFCFYFAENPKLEYLEKADSYYHYITKHLAESSENHFTRVLSLLMQNDGVYQRFGDWKSTYQNEPHAYVSAVKFKSKEWGEAPSFSKRRVFGQYLKDCFRLLRSFSLRSEISWLKLRLKRL